MSIFFAMEERELEKINALHNDLEKIKAEASRKELSEITAILKSDIENMGSLFEIKDGIAHIPIIGQLSENPSLSASLFGQDQTTFGSIIDNIKIAEKDASVKKIVFEIDSPGGTVSGTDQTAQAIRAIKKPTEGRIHNSMASAALWLGVQTDTLIAMTPTAEAGSIGVAAEILDTSEQDKASGIKRHTIVSTGADEKRLDANTKDGREKIKTRITEIHDIFVQRVSEGRGVSEETVRQDFGNGGMLIASKALEVGMIDGIMDGAKLITAKKKVKEGKTALEIMNDIIVTEPAEGAGINNEEVSKMTKDELKAQNPDLYNEMIQAGIEQERDRVKAHLTMGKAADAMETAVKHIESGELMTQTVNAEYMAAGMNKQDVDSRQAEDDKLGDNQTSDTEEDGAAQFDAALKDNLGIVQEAV